MVSGKLFATANKKRLFFLLIQTRWKLLLLIWNRKRRQTMMKSVSFQKCPVKRSLSMKGKENDIQIDLNNCGRYISSGIKYVYLEYH
jgi:hypothetical protein